MSTDFKEYSAAFHDHQNELMHYGVKGMKWHKRKPGAKIISEVAYNANKDEINWIRREAKYKKDLSKLSSDQLLKKIRDTDNTYEFDRVINNGNGSSTLTSDRRRFASDILYDREHGKASEPTDPYKPEKKTGVQKAAKMAARKEEKKRNRKIMNLRKAERAYRRGGH